MPSSLKLQEFSDRELLYVLMDVSDGDGWASAAEVAEKLNLTHKHPVACVSSRFSWLRRYGVLERKETKERVILHRMTKAGQTMLNATLNKRDQGMLDKLDSGQMLMVTNWLTGRYQRVNNAQANLVRREWLYGDAQRKRKRTR